MALAKLWNAVFGKRTSADSSVKAVVGQPVPTQGPSVANAVAQTTGKKRDPQEPVGTPAVVTTAGEKTVKLSRRKTKGSKSKPATPETVQVESQPAATVLRMFKKKNNAWSKLIGSRTVSAVLDINVGDASRACEILEGTVDSASPAPKYIAIGLFELAGQQLSVRQFHQKIRASGGLPIAIPMPLAEGLRRLSETVGTVDLIVLDGPADLSEPTVAKLLARVAAPGALVLRKDFSGRWQTTGLPATSSSRKAA